GAIRTSMAMKGIDFVRCRIYTDHRRVIDGRHLPTAYSLFNFPAVTALTRVVRRRTLRRPKNGGLMVVQRKEPDNPLQVRLSHEQYRRLLKEAFEIDRRYSWIHQYRYLICNSIVSDEAVWLKLN